MMRRLLNSMRLQAALVGEGDARARLGIVTAYDPDNYCAKVTIQPDDIETGWLPINSLFVGEEWGLLCGPEVGAQAVVLHDEGDPDAGVIIGFIWSDAMRPVAGVPSGELWIVHKDGSYTKYLNGGDMRHVHKDGCELHFQGTGKIYAKAPGGFEFEGDTNITGELTVTKNVTDNTPANSVSMKDHRDAYNAHKHAGVQTGAGITATTDTPAT